MFWFFILCFELEFLHSYTVVTSESFWDSYVVRLVCVNKDGCRRQYGKHDEFKFWIVLLMGFCVFTLKLGDELFERISPQVPPHPP
jgi:hypothetical protein